MCGIVGLASSQGIKNWEKRKNFMIDGLYANGLRGLHSTGLALVPSDWKKPTFIYKRAIASIDFLELKKTSTILNQTDTYSFIIGHNRHATRGGIITEMAHPFKCGNITLVHNGTLHSQKNLPDGDKYESDSECIANAIDKEGAAEVIPKLSGAFALVWHDALDDTLHIVRNKERPLSFAFVEKEDTVLFASEAKMLSWLAYRNGMEVTKLWDVNPGNEIIFQNKDFSEYTSVKHELKEIVQNNGYSWYSSNYGSYSNQADTHKKYPKNNSVSHMEKVNDLDLGIRTDEVVCLEIDEFNEYPKSNKGEGVLTCSIPNETIPHKVSIHAVSKEIWGNSAGSIITAQITSELAAKNNGVYLMFTKSQVLPILNEVYEEYDDYKEETKY